MNNKKFCFLKSSTDVHTLGISTISGAVIECGFEVIIGDETIEKLFDEIENESNANKLVNWIKENSFTTLSLSYRLDSQQALKMVGKLVYYLKKNSTFTFNGGKLEKICFAGLPKSCELIEQEFGNLVITFKGGEPIKESLLKLGVSLDRIPNSIISANKYDEELFKFGETIIKEENYLSYKDTNIYKYKSYGTDKDLVVDRLDYCKKYNLGPLIRVHAGPYDSTIKREDAVNQFLIWTKTLSQSGLLDILSIGSSQLTQSNFGENWGDLNNGGGVPINSELEYFEIYQAAKPMLVRTYAGTKNIKNLAVMYEDLINISWHALSFWWFNKLDGRGPYSLKQNLDEHFNTLEVIAKSNKPFEPNVPHHFSFRGADDITYIVSAYLSVKAAKRKGIKKVILQNMLNTPKVTWGIQDLAKSRALLKIVRTLEDNNFKVYLQTRAGLDYFSTDLDKSKIQLAMVTALMDDIEPNNPNSPEIIHVVSYSEASHLATPEIILESIQITKYSLKKYREQKVNMCNPYELEISKRENRLYTDSIKLINAIENSIENPYSAEGFYEIFKNGFLPTPYLWGEEAIQFKNATYWNSKFVNGGIKLVNKNNDLVAIEEIIDMAKSNMLKNNNE